ncbi:serine/threonine-protein kinase PLK1-like isoform X2 [Haemaphysalis longicornis]
MYGLGYQVCDDSVGVLFNNNTRVVLLSNEVSPTYMDENSVENYYSLEEYPATLRKVAALVKLFYRSMKQCLRMTGKRVAPRECDNLAGLSCLYSRLRTQSAISFYLTNGSVQMNFFKDLPKILLCPFITAVCYIKSNRVFHTYRFETLQALSCSTDLFLRP